MRKGKQWSKIGDVCTCEGINRGKYFYMQGDDIILYLNLTRNIIQNK